MPPLPALDVHGRLVPVPPVPFGSPQGLGVPLPEPPFQPAPALPLDIAQDSPPEAEKDACPALARTRIPS